MRWLKKENLFSTRSCDQRGAGRDGRADGRTDGRADGQLGAELAQQGHAPPNPVLLGVVGGQRHGDDEVGGVAGGGERAPALAGLVERRHVAGTLGDV